MGPMNPNAAAVATLLQRVRRRTFYFEVILITTKKMLSFDEE
jgi:hypothetical protein